MLFKNNEVINSLLLKTPYNVHIGCGVFANYYAVTKSNALGPKYGLHL